MNILVDELDILAASEAAAASKTSAPVTFRYAQWGIVVYKPFQSRFPT